MIQALPISLFKNLSRHLSITRAAIALVLVSILAIGAISFASVNVSSSLLSSAQRNFDTWPARWTPQGNTNVSHVSNLGINNTGALVINVDRNGPWPDASRTARVGTPQYVEGVKAKPNTTYIGSAHVKAKNGSTGSARCEIREYNDYQIIKTHTQSVPLVLNENWTRLDCSATTSSNIKQIALRIFIEGADYGETFYADNAELGEPAVVTTTQPPATQPPATQPPTNTTPPSSGTCSPDENVGCIEGNSNGEYFRESFNGNPAAPTSKMNKLDRWFAQPIMQGVLGWDFKPEPMYAQHGPDCSPAPRTHLITSFEQSVFSCRDHLMTAINPPSAGTSSGIVSLKPNHMVDLTKGEATIRVDVSTSSPSRGDWWEVWITPYEDHLIAPNDHWFHHSGPPKRSLFLGVFDQDGKKFWSHKFFDNYRFSGGLKDFWTGPDISKIVSHSDTRRDTYEIKMTKNTVKLSVRDSNTGKMAQVNQFAIPNGGFWTDHAVVQFQQSNYEPEMHGKSGCADPCPKTTVPATWHWDNVEIFPAVPYDIIGVNEFMVYSQSPSKKITFQKPAPVNARLMFSGQSWGNAPEVSFDGGATYQKATAVRGPNDPPVAGFGGDPDLLTYSINAPKGSTSAVIKGRGECSPWGPCNPLMTWSTFNFHIVALR